MRVYRFDKGNNDNLRSDIASFTSTLRNNTFEKNWSVVSGVLQSLSDKHIPHNY